MFPCIIPCHRFFFFHPGEQIIFYCFEKNRTKREDHKRVQVVLDNFARCKIAFKIIVNFQTRLDVIFMHRCCIIFVSRTRIRSPVRRAILKTKTHFFFFLCFHKSINFISTKHDVVIIIIYSLRKTHCVYLHLQRQATLNHTNRTAVVVQYNWHVAIIRFPRTVARNNIVGTSYRQNYARLRASENKKIITGFNHFSTVTRWFIVTLRKVVRWSKHTICLPYISGWFKGSDKAGKSRKNGSVKYTAVNDIQCI